jgi:hypothetical protein
MREPGKKGVCQAQPTAVLRVVVAAREAEAAAAAKLAVGVGVGVRVRVGGGGEGLRFGSGCREL